MKFYRGDHIVKAAKITALGGSDTTDGEQIEGSQFLRLRSGEKVAVSDEFMSFHQPAIGGYFIEFEDGHLDYMSAESFGDKYVLIEGQGDEVGE